MRANRAFRLIVSRGGFEPAFMAKANRLDRIEVVSVEDGEVLLFWNLPARQASKLAKALRGDLVTLEPEQFIATWAGADGEGGG